MVYNYCDTETNLYFLKTRYYDPQVGRFISMDDVAYIDPETIGGTNLFAYCNNNPVMNVDPNGNLFFTAIFLGAVTLFGISILSDALDDRKVFNGSVSLQQYVCNIVIGASVGLFGGFSALCAGAKSASTQLVVDGIASLVAGANRFSTLQDYVTTFAFSGLKSSIKTTLPNSKKLVERADELGLFSITEFFVDHMIIDSMSNEQLYSIIIASGISKFFKAPFVQDVVKSITFNTIFNNIKEYGYYGNKVKINDKILIADRCHSRRIDIFA